MKIILGDSLLKLRDLPTSTVDAVVTDPPYGLSFMNKKWDYDVPSVELWREVFRVMKPGAHLLSFGGTRTYHRMVLAIEEAGFEIRDQIQWIYGSGFPKSQNVAIAIDKQAGAMGARGKAFVTAGQDGREDLVGTRGVAIGGHDPITASAKRWQGWGTALKPACEPIVLARKPLEKGLTVAQNVEKWGTGAINVDARRIGFADGERESLFRPMTENNSIGWKNTSKAMGYNTPDGLPPAAGRWPANVLFDEEAAAMLDEQSGTLKSGALKAGHKQHGSGQKDGDKYGYRADAIIQKDYGNDSGGASRFFYVAKTSKRERNAGLEGVTKEKQGNRPNSKDSTGKFPDHDHRPTGGNNHPTVKPLKLMEYLCRLITPPGGIILDPFLGSGSTGCAAVKLGFQFIGIERELEYVEIAKRRIEHCQKLSPQDLSDDDQLTLPLEPA